MNEEILGKILQDRRKELVLNQIDVAELSGINIKTIYQIENGKGNPSLKTINNLLNVLGLEQKIQIKQIEL